jgi:hypothetical protein
VTIVELSDFHIISRLVSGAPTLAAFVSVIEEEIARAR